MGTSAGGVGSASGLNEGGGGGGAGTHVRPTVCLPLVQLATIAVTPAALHDGKASMHASAQKTPPALQSAHASPVSSGQPGPRWLSQRQVHVSGHRPSGDQLSLPTSSTVSFADGCCATECPPSHH